MKRPILIWAPIFALAVLVSARGAYGQEKKAEQVKEGYVGREQRLIEQYYQNQIDQLRQQAEAELKQFEQEQKDQEAIRENSAEYLKYKLGGYPGGESGVTPEQAKATAESRTAEEKKQIAAKLEQAIAELQKQKEYRLSSLGRLQQQLKESVRQPESKGRLIVNGIAYSKDRQTAMIGGQIVRKGDVIDGTRIVEIQRRKVEFEKNGKTWTQGVGETSRTALQ
jgi:hypothetical protein